MKAFHIILKLIEILCLVPSEELNQLRVDVIAWENKAMSNPDTKVEELYQKIHKGVAFRLVSPFLYLYLQRTANDILNGKSTRDDDLLE